MDSIFEYVDKSQIPSGFLGEYGAEFSNLKTYNGLLTDSNVVSAMAWHYIYASIFSGKIYGTNTLPTPENNYTMFNTVAVTNPAINPVSMLALNYSSIKSYAVSNNLLSVSNSRFYDVEGRPENPYQLNTAFAAAPFYETDNDGVLELLFKQSLFINNTGKTVSSIQVNFADGNGFVTAIWDNPISATYTTTGSKRLTFKLNFTDATILQCYSNVFIEKAYTSGGNRYQPTTVTTPFDPTGNNHSGGDVTVQFSVNNTTPVGNRQFQKPFIVVEGFDMHDAAPLLMPNGNDYNDFRDEIDLVNFSGNSFNFNLDDMAGYDLIFLNYRDGTDNILRNALLLEEVINWVNNNKDVGAQQNVIMGISMGGLVSRYCLAKMTKENNNPQARLLITHDSPHRGANIPLGMQYLINDFATKNFLGRQLQDWIPMLRQAVALQLRDATMQQLIVRDNPSTRALEYNTFLAPGGAYRQMVTFSSFDPQPGYTFIATSQGSQCGIAVMPPSTLMAHASGNAGYSFIYGAFGTKYSGEVSVNALPNGTASQRITYFDLKSKDKIFWIPFTTTIMHFEHFSPSGILGYDGPPAGTQPLSRGTGIGNMPPSGSSSPWWLVGLFQYAINFNGLQLQPDFSFVPTVSALDEDNITATSLYAPHIGANYVPPANLTVLQRYIAQETETITGGTINNIEHTNFTGRNSNWLWNEMENVTPNNINCANECTNPAYTISGPSIVCNSENYSIPGLSANIAWSINPSIATVNAAGTVTKTGNGLATLIATITDPCNGSVSSTTKPIQIGTFSHSQYTIYSWPNTLCYGQNVQFGPLSGQVTNATSYNWIYSGGLTYVSGQNTRVITLKVPNYSPYQTGGDVGLAVGNACGVSSYFPLTHFNYTNCGLRLAASPNPATFNITITIVDENGNMLSDPEAYMENIEVIDKVGVTHLKIKLAKKTKQTNLNVSNLKPDIYFIKVWDGKEWSSIKFEKK